MSTALRIETRGVTTRRRDVRRPLSWMERLGAWTFNAGVPVLLWVALVAGFRLFPLPDAMNIGLALGGTVAAFALGFQFLKCSIGKKIWLLGGKTGFTATAALWILIVAGSNLTILRHPALSRISITERAPLAPTQTAEAAQEWITLPFYYAFGAWPKRFEGNPVFYDLPYEKGPPSRFIGKIVARWRMPDVRFVMEGPKSPEPRFTREELKNCLTSRVWGCLRLRDLTLRRPLEALNYEQADEASVQWIDVRDPGVSGAMEQNPAGLLIQLHRGSTWITRWILVTENGSHQSFTLYDHGGSDGETARRLADETIRTLRVTDRLSSTQGLAALKLSELDLKSAIESKKNAANWLAGLADIQATLLARVTVDPKDLNAYYHLGGSSLMFLKKIESTRKELIEKTGHADQVNWLIDDWTAALRPLVETAARYAWDVAPDDPKSRQLGEMAAQANKLK